MILGRNIVCNLRFDVSCIVWRDLRRLPEMLAPAECRDDAIRVEKNVFVLKCRCFRELSRTEANYTCISEGLMVITDIRVNDVSHIMVYSRKTCKHVYSTKH